MQVALRAGRRGGGGAAARRADGGVSRLQGHGAADHQVIARRALRLPRPRAATSHTGPGARLHGQLLVRTTLYSPVRAGNIQNYSNAAVLVV